MWQLWSQEWHHIKSRFPFLSNFPPDAFCIQPSSQLKDSHLVSAVCCEESCLLITVWSRKHQCFIRTTNYRQRRMSPEERGVPTHSFVHARAERHPRADTGVCVIKRRAYVHKYTSPFPLRFAMIHLSQRWSRKMTRLTAPPWLVSDTNMSLPSIWGPWTLLSLFVSYHNPGSLYCKEICQSWV